MADGHGGDTGDGPEGDLARFLDAELPDHVALYFADGYLDADALTNAGTPAGDGVVLVVPGERGRSLFSEATGLDAMGFAREAGATDGTVADDLGGGSCPAADGADGGDVDGDATAAEDHRVEFMLAFVQPETPDVGGRYAEGDVLHAYAACACGETFAERRIL